MDLAAQGMSDRQIGLELGISRDTVASYWRRILLKFGSSKRTEVVARFAEQQAAKTVADVQQSNLQLQEEISIRRSVELADAPKRLMLSASAAASASFIDGKLNLFEILAQLLKDVLKATDASFGFFAETSVEAAGGSLGVLGILDSTWNRAEAKEHHTLVANGWQVQEIPAAFQQVLSGEKKIGIERRQLTVPAPTEPPRGPFVIFPIKHGADTIGLLALTCKVESIEEGLPEIMEPMLQLCGKMISARHSDIQRHLAEAKAESSAKFIQSLIHSFPNAVMYETIDRKVEFVNTKFRECFSVPFADDELSGFNCRDSQTGCVHLFKDPTSFVARVDQLVRDQRDCLQECVLMADGRILERDFVVLRTEGQVQGYLWIYRDVTSIFTA